MTNLKRSRQYRVNALFARYRAPHRLLELGGAAAGPYGAACMRKCRNRALPNAVIPAPLFMRLGRALTAAALVRCTYD